MRKIIDVIETVAIVILLGLAYITGSGGSFQSKLPFFAYTNGSDVLSGITTLTIALLGIVTIIDLCLAFGLEPLVPSFIVKAKKRVTEDIINQVIDSYSARFNEQWEAAAIKALDAHYGKDFSRYSELLEVYFKKDLAFVKSNQQARTDYILEKLRLTQPGYEKALDCLTRLRAMPLANTQDAINRIEHILRKMPGIVIPQAESPSDRTYKEVQFYLDFISSMREDEYGKEIAETFAQYIMLDLQDLNIKNVTKVVIPADSNFLLGFKVGQSLGYPQVIVRNSKGRIFKDRPWDGELNRRDKVIIVHDVLVSGTQVVSAMKKIRSVGAEIVAVYCIVKRLERSGEKKVHDENRNCKVRAMLALDDKTISEKYYNEGNNAVLY